jgi:hypothetical protein
LLDFEGDRPPSFSAQLLEYVIRAFLSSLNTFDFNSIHESQALNVSVKVDLAPPTLIDPVIEGVRESGTWTEKRPRCFSSRSNATTERALRALAFPRETYSHVVPGYVFVRIVELEPTKNFELVFAQRWATLKVPVKRRQENRSTSV